MFSPLMLKVVYITAQTTLQLRWHTYGILTPPVAILPELHVLTLIFAAHTSAYMSKRGPAVKHAMEMSEQFHLWMIHQFCYMTILPGQQNLKQQKAARQTIYACWTIKANSAPSQASQPWASLLNRQKSIHLILLFFFGLQCNQAINACISSCDIWAWL